MPPQTPKDNEPEPQTGQLGQAVDKLKSADSVLVTVNTNPNVDQLAACIGLALVLNKAGKHATAVFSGEVPSTLDFLKPEKTIEKSTDSLRDFIISLDKSKADKLRYKVEDDVVKIFITPYKTQITEKDFNFSQGEVNVDAVVALGVKDKADLDKAITAHGRILHDATVISLATAETKPNHLGSINWTAEDASSLCEMVADLALELNEKGLDNQIATALLTGVISETERFSNAKSSPHTMSIAGKLMEAGASTQLITTKLEEEHPEPAKPAEPKVDTKGGILEIPHEEPPEEPVQEPPKPPEKPPEPKKPEEPPGPSRITNVKQSDIKEEEQKPPAPPAPPSGGLVSEPPERGGNLTANAEPDYQRYSPSIDPMSIDKKEEVKPPAPDLSNEPTKSDYMDNKTLSDIERSLGSSHILPSKKEDKTIPSSPPIGSAQGAAPDTAGNEENQQPDHFSDINAKEISIDEEGNLSEAADQEDKPSGSPPPPPSGPPAGPPPPVPPPMTPSDVT